MKITVIHGSMRRGNTYALTQAVLERLKAHGDVELTEFRVSELELPFCASCHLCFERGEDACPHRAILRPVTDAIESCDALVASGVVYALHLNAAMKNLIDHLAYYMHRPRLFDKQALVVTTTAGAAERAVAKYLRHILNEWGITTVRSLSLKIQVKPFSLKPKQRARMERVADAFYEDVKQRRLAPPDFRTVILINAFRGMNSAEKAISPYDQAYWRETGMVDQPFPRRISPAKAAVGNLMAAVMRRVIGGKR